MAQLPCCQIPPVLVQTTQRDRIFIAIDSWTSDSQFPLGHFVRTLGDIGVTDVEKEVLLHEHKKIGFW